jgi:hypothetical protein
VWLDNYGVRTPRAERYATLAAWVYPSTERQECAELVSDVSSFFRVFDDFTDAQNANLPTVHRVSQELSVIPYGGRPVTVAGRMFAELWERQIEGMPPHWVVRATRHWEGYFATQVAYAAMLNPRFEWDTQTYLELRQANGAVPISFDLAEAALRKAVEPHVYHCTRLRLMRRVTSDALIYTNDFYSSVRDSEHDDPRNLVALIQRQAKCSWKEAAERVSAKLTSLNHDFDQHAAHLVDECALLGFGEEEMAQAAVGTEAARDWLYGYQAWAAGNEFRMDTDPPRTEVTARLTD